MFRPDDYGPSMVYSAVPISYAHLYPSVPEPDEPSVLHLLAVKWSVGDVHAEDMPGIAADLLESGFDTTSLRRLAGETALHSSADAEPLVERVFRELGVKYPIEEREARLIAIRQIAREVIAGRRNPWAAASYIEIVICNRLSDEKWDDLFSLRDELDWDEPYGRNVPTLTEELVKVFAELASVSTD